MHVLCRYRKIAADRCQGGDIVDKYKAIPSICPILPPSDLIISRGGMASTAVETGKDISVEFIQGKVERLHRVHGE